MKAFAQDMYDRTRVSDLVLDQPSTFDPDRGLDGIRTLILLCDSDQLEHIAYKPDFPQSLLHLSLYDGSSSILAERALNRIRKFRWNMRFVGHLQQFFNSRLAAEALGLRQYGEMWMTDGAARILNEMLPAVTTIASMNSIGEERRLLAIEKIVQRLHSSSEVQEVASSSPREYLRMSEDPLVGQGAFWSVEGLNEISGLKKKSSLVNRVHSTYVTPPELALDVINFMASNIAGDELVDFGDPAIGSGILFATARHVLGAERVNSARGVDIDGDSARKTLHRWRRSNLSVTVGDFIEAPQERSVWSFVAANPPYRRSQLLSSSMEPVRRQIARDLDLKVTGRADLYVYFVLRAHSWMRAGAIAAWILPAEFQVAEYAKPLREYLSRHVTLLRTHTYDSSDRQFDNALASTSVIVFRNEIPAPDHVAVFSDGGTLAEPDREHVLSVSDIQRRARWNFALLASDQADSAGDFISIADLFSVKRGIATGSNGHFILTDAQLEELQVRRDWVQPLMPRARYIPDAHVMADSFGDPIPSSGLWLINTSETIDHIREISPGFASYLNEVEAAVGDRALVRRRSPIYRQEFRAVAPFVFVYMAKSSVSPARRFIRNDSRAAILNNYLGLYPHESTLRWLGEDQSRLDQLHELLSRVSETELLMRGRSYGHGLLKVEPKELLDVRLPLLRTEAELSPFLFG